MESPKISVIIPVYQGDTYLSEAVQSTPDRLYTDFEFLILCDDPSDKTPQITPRGVSRCLKYPW